MEPWSVANPTDQVTGFNRKGRGLTLYRSDDTSDIAIPSAFVSRASYTSILRTWDDEQQDGDKAANEPRGLVVTMSKDEMFTW